MPEIISFIITIKNKFIANIIARARTRIRVRAILLLQFWSCSFIYYRYFHFMFHNTSILYNFMFVNLFDRVRPYIYKFPSPFSIYMDGSPLYLSVSFYFSMGNSSAIWAPKCQKLFLFKAPWGAQTYSICKAFHRSKLLDSLKTTCGYITISRGRRKSPAEKALRARCPKSRLPLRYKKLSCPLP